MSPEINPQIPHRPHGPQKPKPIRTFDDILKDLQPQLDKLPPDQQIPLLPPDQMVLDSVQEFVRDNGMVVPDSCPPTIAVAGEFLDRTSIREGRVGLLRNLRVISFLRRYPDKSLRAVVIFPCKGVDARTLGMSIFWGQVADVPLSVAKSEICSLSDFFAINSFHLTDVIDVSSLELYKLDYARELDKQLAVADRRLRDAEKKGTLLESLLSESEAEKESYRHKSNDFQNRSEWWKFIAFGLLALSPIAFIALRALCGFMTK